MRRSSLILFDGIQDLLCIRQDPGIRLTEVGDPQEGFVDREHQAALSALR